MTIKEKRRVATQLNLDPNMWVMIEEATSYIKYQHAKTGEVKKFYYGGETR